MKLDPAASGIFSVEFLGAGVSAAFSGREYPAARRAAFLRDAGFGSAQPILANQVHGDQVARVSSPFKVAPKADALITNVPGLTLGILTADCIPVFLWDARQKAAGLVHAGWRGVERGVLGKALAAMREAFGTDPAELRAAFGASIRSCCYEVGPEFAEIFPGFYEPPAPGREKGRMDLAAAAADQLGRAGLRREHLKDSGLCTACLAAVFFSARRERTAERILSVIRIA